MILKVSLDDNKTISHHSKINGTNVTINDLIRHDDKLKVGEYTFEKKCKWHNMKCMVYKCKKTPDGEKKSECKISITKKEEL